MRAPSGSPLIGWFWPEPHAAPIPDPAAARRAYVHWRLRMFAGFFAGYFVLYFCRKNISNALPAMAADLGYSNTALGVIGTALYVVYGIGKFANGVLADRANIRRFMASGLIVSGLLNLLFPSGHAVWLLALIWGLNGWFQSMGFPPIARGMTLWFAPQGKSWRWALWTCSHQAGTAAIMGLTAWILTWASWRACFWLPGLVCIGMGLLLLWLLADTPESRGLASARAFVADAGGRPGQSAVPDSGPAAATLTVGAGPLAGQGPAPAVGAAQVARTAAGAGDDTYRDAFVRHVLRNRNVWAIGLIDLCVYVVRYGTLDWTKKYLMEAKGYDATAAGLTASLLPVAGVLGVLASGFIADAVFKARYRTLNALCLIGLGGCLYGLLAAGRGHFWLDVALLIGIGFFVEGPQSILGGVGAVDAGGSARVASSAAGLVGILAYFGASLSGVGSGLAIDTWGWDGALWFWIGCSALGLALCLGLWRERAPAGARAAVT